MAPKAKKPLSARAKAKLKEQKRLERQAKIDAGEIIVNKAPKADPMKKKILGSLGGKSVSEAAEEFKKALQLAQAELQEAEAMEKAQSAQAEEAKGDVEKAKAEIAAATQKEIEAAAKYKEVVGQRSEVTKQVEDARKELYEAQKKVAMLEVLAVNHAKMKALEETRKAAQAAAEAARKNMLEQKQREKEALEATRRALAETRAAAKGGGKRKVHPDEADTIPATLPDGSQAADID